LPYLNGTEYTFGGTRYSNDFLKLCNSSHQAFIIAW